MHTAEATSAANRTGGLAVENRRGGGLVEGRLEVSGKEDGACLGKLS